MKSHLDPNKDETLDTIKDVKIIQSKEGYRFSIDAILLEDFITAKRLEKGIELGTGSGIISILLAKRLKNAEITAVEIQEPLAERARKNTELNDLKDNINILSMDMKELKKEFPANGFDFVFSNPPFRKPKTGRMSTDEERAIARHEIEISLPDLISTAAYLLKHNRRFYMIYHPFRLAELISLLRASRLEPKRMRFVHSRQSEEAKMVMIEAVKGGGIWLKIDPPLYLYEKGNDYTREARDILKT
ncbi:tRNA1(Val) (adenine(37)-N6)-methyltransferase [bacterium BMS3Bbin09]|nr:tRNA1(Val) (adenine(37)-N6)-methyltransferase [bacterium BMS3Bbin09]HDH34421.1 tRNA1(Val) (adenine(37)-N6)-methyltransferase [Nitrospirota bacterium]